MQNTAQFALNASGKEKLETQFVSCLNKDSEFCIDFEDAYKWVGYSRKDVAKRTLIKNFQQGTDYELLHTKAEQVSGAKHVEQITLTPECFKSFCMLAQTSQGREIRKYFIETEKKFRSGESHDGKFRVTAEQAGLLWQIGRYMCIAQHQTEAMRAHAQVGVTNGNYAGFYCTRKQDIGWDAKSVKDAVERHCVENNINATRVLKNLTTIAERLSYVEPTEAVKCGVYDFLKSQGIKNALALAEFLKTAAENCPEFTDMRRYNEHTLIWPKTLLAPEVKQLKTIL